MRVSEVSVLYIHIHIYIYIYIYTHTRKRVYLKEEIGRCKLLVALKELN